MPTIAIYNQEGKKTKELTVSKEVFDLPFNNDLVSQALVRQHANARIPAIAHTKTKGEITGSKKKPFRQKGTGKARQGSSLNPHQIGGGVSFGPRNNRNYKQSMPKKQRRLALFIALSQKLREEKIIGLDNYNAEKIQTKEFSSLISKLPVEKDVLFVLETKNDIIEKSARNIPYAKTILVNYLNIADLQRFDKIIFFESALRNFENVFKPN